MTAPTHTSLWSTRTAAIVALFSATVFLSACAPEPEDMPPAASAETSEQAEGDASDGEDTAEAPEATDQSEDATDADSAPAHQEATCDWENAKITGEASAPSGEEGDLSTALIGAWQHAQIDSGDGFEPVSADIRYVFPSDGGLLYCQDAPGTPQAENATEFELNGTTVQPPGGHPGFEVLSWSANSMLWNNNMDDTTYLLVRR